MFVIIRFKHLVDTVISHSYTVVVGYTRLHVSCIVSRDVTKFAFKFDDVRTSNVFSRFEIRRNFLRPMVEFESQVYMIGSACLHPAVSLTLSEMLKVIVFVGCVN